MQMPGSLAFRACHSLGFPRSTEAYPLITSILRLFLEIRQNADFLKSVPQGIYPHF